MTTNDIRKKFLDFFASKGHSIVQSDSLVPKDDPTVLFTTAGMQQFKKQFLGHIEDYTKATTSQKCLRTDDLDEVGQTDFHHTFFEMLGNFSFGDYFKKEAITWGWEFLTEVVAIDKAKLWVSVYKDDTEAKDIWLNDVQIPEDKLVALGDKSNFWPADAKKNGPNGPCGPCSEIFFDYGKNPNCPSKVCDPSCDCGRFSEIWNLVFTQFNRLEGGVLEPLPSKNIDTGMGLERLVSVLQGKKNNFDIDAFAPIMQAIEDKTSHQFPLEIKEKRIIADHMRAIVFGIADGVNPSNEKRGYIMRKLIIDTTDIILEAGAKEPLSHQLVSSVIDAMKDPYPELIKKEQDITLTIKRAEEAYIKVKKERVPQLKSDIQKILNEDKNKQGLKLGQIRFTFKDTYGLTLAAIDTTISSFDIDAATVDQARETYQTLMKEQQDQSRASSKMTGDVFSDISTDIRVKKLDKTKFLGYEKNENKSIITMIISENKPINEAHEKDEVQIVLDQTCFYAESGGQIGDSGTITTDNATFIVKETIKQNDVFYHFGHLQKGTLKVNDPVTATIEQERRLAIMYNHTATHLLQAALRNVLGDHIKQQGSLVAEDRLRFDFSHHSAIKDDQIYAIEEQVNQYIRQCDAVSKEEMSLKEAQKSEALAFFAEKYGNTVRVVSMGDYSKEFCGGTHLDWTGQIGVFKIIQESAVAQGIRRIEAKTGAEALKYIKKQEDELREVSKVIKVPTNEILQRTKEMMSKMKSLQKELQQYRINTLKNQIDSLLTKSEELDGFKIITHVFTDAQIDTLRPLADLIKQKCPSAVITLGGINKDNGCVLTAVTDDVVKKGIKANEIIAEIIITINGKGGGRAQLAQAGTEDVKKIDAAIGTVTSIIKEKLNT